MTTLFISDLHLSAEQPELSALFIRFLEQHTNHTETLYILGDLFEVWLGDDMVLPDYQNAIQAMKAFTDRGIPLYVMYGNRDFLMREQFEQQTGCQLIPDTLVIDLYGTPTLLMHGDTLCTDDVEYMKFREMVRNPDWQNELLAKSPEERLALAKHYREISKQQTGNKTNEIMDVNQAAVEKTMREQQVSRLIHGHTHRPATHEFELDGNSVQRIVLSDWGNQGHFLSCSSAGCKETSFT